ncbi:MAG: MBL fold metallo-hydrolase [Acholeplasmatales bacterium]|jgi:L-ascorbate metabolism protein UlaG (beta-lactamase superfamily)|nr:MBL fold metallo-hydrolase [Acholeplasmatales bacterium]
MAKLYYQGHGSYRLTSNSGLVIYVDPYAGRGYDQAADIILVTHQHSDHNQIDKCPQKDDCQIISNFEALKNNIHQSFKVKGIHIQAVEASNRHHDPTQCVGYIIEIDGLKIYASGDTSLTKQMQEFPQYQLDYALLPLDGIYNMNLEEGAHVASLIKAKHNIPIHLKPGELFDQKRAQEWKGINKLIIHPNEEINLSN